MKTTGLILFALFLLTSLATAGQPKLVEAKITPEKASVGDTVKVTIEFTGKASDIKKVYLTVREYPYDAPDMPLSPMDVEKNIWVIEQPVPSDAPAEVLNLDITAIDKKDKEIVTKGFENNYTGKAGSVKFEVTY